MDWNRILTAVVTSGVLALAGALGTLMTLVFKTYKDVKVIKAQGEHRQEENKLQFKSIFALIRCARTGVANGELKAVEEEMNSYLRDQAIR